MKKCSTWIYEGSNGTEIYWKKSEHDKMVHYALDSKILEGTKSYTVKASQIILIEPRDK
jgi:hypothetical protein